MKLHHLKRKQILNLTIGEAWDFFSRPANLEKITPSTVGFEITHISGENGPMYAGQIICYRIRIFPLFATFWMTEIKHIRAPYYFSDEQRFGPYAYWNHQHHFREVADRVEMTDELTYAIPYGFIGMLANRLFVERRVNEIFDHRERVLAGLFPGSVVLTSVVS